MSGSVRDDTSQEAAPEVDEGHDHPRGTMLIVLLMVVFFAAMWAWAYYLLIYNAG